MFADLPADPLERTARSTHAQGLANSLRLSGTGTQAWLQPALATINSPTLTLAGTNDSKFSGEAIAIQRAVPGATVRLIDGAGHAAHLEQPERAATVVATFLAS
jgi:pimeloyl-ACP methyl ester carboxylesterase